MLNIEKVDTKDASTDYCKIPGGRGGKYKWPTLSELHEKLFGVPFDGAHNSAFDVDATARCFFGLLKEQVITPFDNTPLTEIKYERPNLEEAVRDMPQNAPQKTKVAGPPQRKKVDVNKIETAPFSHLHVHSQYSILQSTASIKQLVNAAKERNMPAIAVTDLGNLFGAFKAVAEGKKQGVKVIIGCDVYMTKDRHQKKFTKDFKDQRSVQLLLAKNQNGYQNLAKLCSLGYIEGYYGGFPRVDKELIQEYAKDLIATTGGISGEIPDLILNTGEHQAEEAFRWWLEVFGNDFYVELQRHGLEEEDRVNEVMLRLADKYGVKVIATNNVYYANQKEANAHDTLLCVKNNEVLSTPIGRGRNFRFGMPNHEFYLKTEEEMKQLFADRPDAITNTFEIAEKAEELTLQRGILLPKFALPDGFTDQNDYLRHLSYEGAKPRYGEITLEIQERLDHELKIIKDMGFPGYFLIVQDFINAARKMGVSVGPGRGSAAGSVVAYCTGITNIDPIEYDLLFERFLNPERISMPDIDIDFDDDGRQEVINYVIEKYGQNQVAQIVTFGTMAPRMSIRDVSRVSELPLVDANRLATLVPEKPGTTFEQALAEVPELQQIKRGSDKQAEVINLAHT
ncbi:MAG: DNA polymerase III subunit alpha, partial [Bacteroidota bacterium]